MKLYTALNALCRFIGNLYFAEAHVAGRHRIPANGPVVVAANHPSSLLDAILLANQVPRPIHFLARSGLFRWPVVATLFRWLGTIPIYRAGESSDHAARNEASFERVYAMLEAGGCVGIFPEGRNSPGNRVAPLRSGTARMALGTEARNGFALGLVIVPAGIAFESRALLTSAVAVRFGEPIRVADFAAQHEASPAEAVAALTRTLEAAIRRQALHVEDRSLDDLAADLAWVFEQDVGGAEDPAAADAPAPARRRLMRWLLGVLAWYRRTSPASARALGRRMQRRERILHVLTRGNAEEPHAVAALRKQVERFKDHLEQNRLRLALDESLDEPARMRWPRLRMSIYAVAVAPVALFGVVHNIVPYLLTRLGAGRIRDDAVRAFAGFGIGLAAFLGIYAAIAAWLWQSGTASLAGAIAYVALLPPTGVAALSYRRALAVYRRQILLRTLFWNRRERLELLRHEREVIVERFRALAERHREA